MINTDSLSQSVESYRLKDIISLWAEERLEHEIVVASSLARAIIRDGLRIQSVDGRWATRPPKPVEFHGYPYVGYTARPGSAMCILRIEALNHLMAIVEQGQKPDMDKLHEEFIYRDDFRAWLQVQNLHLPKFWFA